MTEKRYVGINTICPSYSGVYRTVHLEVSVQLTIPLTKRNANRRDRQENYTPDFSSSLFDYH